MRNRFMKQAIAGVVAFDDEITVMIVYPSIAGAPGGIGKILGRLFNIQIGITESNVDNLGHLGGLIVGVIMGFAIAENDSRRQSNQAFTSFIKNTNYKNKCGIIFLFSYLLAFLLVFYLLIEV